MKKSRKMLNALLALAMTASLLASCGSDPSSSSVSSGEEETSSKTFVMAVSENMKSLDPYYQTTITGKTFTQMYLESLIMYDETTGEFFPWLCESYEYSPDGLEWTFHMREGLKWSNGEVLDANDVAYSFERLLSDPEGSPIASQYWADLERVELIDDLTVKLICKVPVANMRVSLVKTYIIPDETHKEKGDDMFYNQDIPASGPWVLDEWVDGQYIKLHKNEDYWRKDWFDSYYDNVEIRFITEPSTGVTAHVSGDIQAYIPSGGISVDILPLYSGTEDKIDVFSFLSGSYSYAGMSFKEGSPFNDENFRWAFEYAIDRQGIVDNILGGGVVPNSEALDSCLGYNPDLEPYVYDPELAKEYLEKSSYNGEPFEIVTNNAIPKAEDTVLYISECLNAIGMNTTARIVEVAELQSIRAEGDYTVFVVNNMHGCGDIGNDLVLRILNDAHHSYYSGPVYDQLCELIREQSTELDVDKRAGLIQEVERVIRENAAPHSYLCQYESTFAIDYGVTGLEPFADGTFRFTFVTYDPNSQGNEFPDFSQFIEA